MDRKKSVILYSAEQSNALRSLALIEGKTISAIVSECLNIGIKEKSSAYKEKFDVLMNALNVCSETGSGC